jgi:hypothetical protein
MLGIGNKFLLLEYSRSILHDFFQQELNERNRQLQRHHLQNSRKELHHELYINAKEMKSGYQDKKVI